MCVPESIRARAFTQAGAGPVARPSGEIDGDLYLFAGAERSNHIFMFKLVEDYANATVFDPNGVEFVDAILVNGQISPEGFFFINAANSPTGGAMLLVGNEVSGTWSLYAVPEPTSGLLMALAAGTAVFVRRRRRA